MTISVFDLFKIGIGPSSSHTVGPMRAAADFVDGLRQAGLLDSIRALNVTLFGSLASTGIGHATDNAVVAGLMGQDPETVDPVLLLDDISTIKRDRRVLLGGTHAVDFIWNQDLIFCEEPLPFHPNALRIVCTTSGGNAIEETYYSVGGGFVLTEKQLTSSDPTVKRNPIPYDFKSGKELLAMCAASNLSIAELVMDNEKSWKSESDIRDGLLLIWDAMKSCVQQGLDRDGILPGGLGIKRRAKRLHQSLLQLDQPTVISSTLAPMEWANVYALAVNEENAAGGRVVTAPTNGAAGIIPAVLHYFVKYSPNADDDDIVRFFLTASAIGVLCKTNASISGAEVGCQGEVGSASAMAAAGLAEVLGGTPSQVENAAEIALEHCLGLTCDPVAGLVQVPCIERNAIAAVKAINAAQMALRGSGEHFISLDSAIRSLRDIGSDMHSKYKETSKGGLAVNYIEC